MINLVDDDHEIHNNNERTIILSDNGTLFDGSYDLNGKMGPSMDKDTRILGAMSIAEVWGWAFLFVTIINLSSVMGIIFFPLMKKSFYTLVMRTMIGLAIGSLSGSALFHLIPAAFDLSTMNAKGQNYINIAFFIWLSMWIVMLLECTIKIIVKMNSKKSMSLYSTSCDEENKVLRNNNHGHNHNHTQFPMIIRTSATNSSNNSNADIPQDTEIPSDQDQTIAAVDDDDEVQEQERGSEGNHPNALTGSNKGMAVYHSTFSINKKAIRERPQEIKTVAWLIIIGDSLHNFIDGISIGAAFVKDFRTGAVISLAIMCEEFPHELGDFAILINSGFSVKKALIVNFLSALTCYLGMALGIVLGEIEWANFIFAFAAGIFLYVSLADMIPEITSLIEEVSEISPKKAWSVLLTHNIGIITGISILYVLAAVQIQ